MGEFVRYVNASDQPCPAIVTAPNLDGTLVLTIFPHSGPAVALNVPQATNIKTRDGRVCCWQWPDEAERFWTEHPGAGVQVTILNHTLGNP